VKLKSKVFEQVKSSGIAVGQHFIKGSSFVVGLSDDRKKLLINEGEAKIKVFPSKKHKQVVLQVFAKNQRD
jgi:hypothetical protein